MNSPSEDLSLAGLEEDMAALRDFAGLEKEEEDTGVLAPSSLDKLRGDIDELIGRDEGMLGYLRSRTAGQRVFFVALVAVAATGAALAMRPIEHLTGAGMWCFAAMLMLVATITVLACWRLMRPLHLPPANRWVGNLLLLTGVALPFLMAFTLNHEAGKPVGTGALYYKQCAMCLALGLVLGLPVLGLALLLRRAKVDGAAIGALAGVAAGLTSYLTLHVHCTISDPAHVVGGHASVLLVLTVGAAVWHLRERSRIS